MDQNLLNNIEQYKAINWKSLTREESFAKEKNFSSQKKIFDQVKRSFDLIFDNIELLSESLPSGEINNINNQINQLIQLKNRIDNYSDTNRHAEMTNDIKQTCFSIQTVLVKYLEYINPGDIKEKINKELDEIVKVKDDVAKVVDEKLKVLEQGIQKTSEGKRKISGVELSKFYEAQSGRHRESAEGDKKKTFLSTLFSGGWLRSRNVIFFSIIVLIMTVVVLYVLTFLFMDSRDKWKELWGVHMSVLFVALLSVLYAGLYFSTKNYDREKELEYKNKVRANIANTWLLISAGQDERTIELATKEAAKTLFSDIEMSEENKGQENRNISISIPQSIGKNLNNE